MHISEIDYDLPERLIAQEPVEPRDSARLLVSLVRGERRHLKISDLPSLLGPGDVVVVNDTRVLPARLRLERRTGGAAEVLLLEARDAEHREWEAMIRPARKLRTGETLTRFGRPVVEVGERTEAGDTFVVTIVVDNPDDFVERHGEMPLPPYIRRVIDDNERYQTVYSRRPASAAAPTAGLHFTTGLMAELEERGVTFARVELVVGLDTFKPVSAENPLDHQIHTEWYSVPPETVDACRGARRVVAVGTTAARALESTAATGRSEGRTDLFIVPGHEWKVVDVLLTNFHMPRTSLLLMVGSFVGGEWRDIYRDAVSESYRFLSFGDAMLLGRRAPGADPGEMRASDEPGVSRA
ncbi:MAG: S-adenosylmethionine:tRNA ribosyltransferase-isomerase [Actinomycetota bacterium]